MPVRDVVQHLPDQLRTLLQFCSLCFGRLKHSTVDLGVDGSQLVCTCEQPEGREGGRIERQGGKDGGRKEGKQQQRERREIRGQKEKRVWYD